MAFLSYIYAWWGMEMKRKMYNKLNHIMKINSDTWAERNNNRQMKSRFNAQNKKLLYVVLANEMIT